MIETFKHKGVRDFFTTGARNKIINEHHRKLKMVLEILNAAENIKDINFPGSNLHRLKGDLQDNWSVRINGNWRIIFRFNQGKVYDVDYIDYH